MANKLEQQYPQFFELNGTALNDGYIYIGVNGLNPETNPIPIFLDEDLTTPISQPLRTSGGYIYYNGSPVSIYFNESTYSITVKNSLSNLIYTILSNNAFSYPKLIDTIEDLATYAGTGLVIVKDIARGGNFVSKTAIEINPHTGSLYVVDGGTVFAKLGGGFWARPYSGAVNVKWFGAIKGGDISYIINEYLLDKDIIIDEEYTASVTIGTYSTISLSGSTKNAKIIASADINLFSIKGSSKIQNITLSSSVTSTKACITTNETDFQLNGAIFDNVEISNFKIGLYARYSLWSTFRNITIRNCMAGIILSGNDTVETFYNITGNWNSWSNGFFHNANTFDNIYIQGGELGIFICGRSNSFNNITTQGQSSLGITTNEILPTGQDGTGIWIAGSSSYSSGSNSFNALYIENTRSPINLFRANASIDSLFVQGGLVTSKYPQVIIADSSSLTITSSSGQDWFDNLILFKSTYSTSTVIGTVPGTTATTETTSGIGYYRNDAFTSKKHFYIYHAPGTASGTTYKLSSVVGSIYSIYRITGVGVRDGYSHNTGEWILTVSVGGLKSIVEQKVMGSIIMSQDGFAPLITVNTSMGYEIHLFVEKLETTFKEPSSDILITTP